MLVVAVLVVVVVVTVVVVGVVGNICDIGKRLAPVRASQGCSQARAQ